MGVVSDPMVNTQQVASCLLASMVKTTVDIHQVTSCALGGEDHECT